MSNLEQQFIEDRRLRDAARAVLMADIEHARESLSATSVAERVADRIGDGAKDVFETAREHAEDNGGIIAMLIGAVLLWFGREPVLELLGLSNRAEDTEELETTDAEAVPAAPHPTPGDDNEQ